MLILHKYCKNESKYSSILRLCMQFSDCIRLLAHLVFGGVVFISFEFAYKYFYFIYLHILPFNHIICRIRKKST